MTFRPSLCTRLEIAESNSSLHFGAKRPDAKVYRIWGGDCIFVKSTPCLFFKGKGRCVSSQEQRTEGKLIPRVKTQSQHKRRGGGLAH